MEKFLDVWGDILPLLRLHWEEVGVNKEKIVLCPQVEEYKKLENLDCLHIVTAREQGKLIGYHVSLVKPHLHYGNTLHAFTDIYFIDPFYRNKPRIAWRLFNFIEKTLKDRGVVRIITTTKTSLNKGRFLSALGYSETDVVYTKLI